MKLDEAIKCLEEAREPEVQEALDTIQAEARKLLQDVDRLTKKFEKNPKLRKAVETVRAAGAGNDGKNMAAMVSGLSLPREDLEARIKTIQSASKHFGV